MTLLTKIRQYLDFILSNNNDRVSLALFQLQAIVKYGHTEFACVGGHVWASPGAHNYKEPVT